MAAFTDAQKMRIRRSLGYMGLSEGEAISFGLVVNIEYVYLLNARMERVSDQQLVTLVTEELERVEETERQMFAAQKRLAATAIGSIRTNPEEMQQLADQRDYWARRLAGLLGVPFYASPWSSGGRNSINARVVC